RSMPRAVFVSPDSLSRFYQGEMATAPGNPETETVKQIAPIVNNENKIADNYKTADTTRVTGADEGVAWSRDAKREAAKPAAAPPPATTASEKAIFEQPKETKPEAVVVQGRAESNSNDRRNRGVENFNEVVVTANAAKKKQARQATDNEDVLMDNAAQRSNNMGAFNRNFNFNYRITDSKGNGIPYANIAIPADQLVTYARSDGSFGLFSADSVLRVNFKAAGYEPKSFLLTNNNQTSNIVLKEEVAFNNKDMVVVGEQKNFAIRKKADKSVTDEAEPLDGWVNYDSYLANNIDASNKNKGVVELSFELNKKGEITGVTVEKSLGAREDEEAIRLLTQGPKWKGKKKKAKGRVTVTF
ncbi:MAG: energy transducer TonB, partial [Dinghuibacter sp.]|nr:energy transducer TonB [Dinghuibacter sp.]